MTKTTRKIGLSLGADVCWPICFEEIVRQLDLSLPIDDEEVSFEVRRVTIEPFDLAQDVDYDVVLDRLTYWYFISREWIKKAVLMNDLYVLNNPWSIQSNAKHTSYCAMMKLGMPIPRTALVPPKEYDETPDLDVTLRRYAKLFRLEEVGRSIGYPVFMKPFDGGGWVGVSKIETDEELLAAYDASGTRLMHVQKGMVPYDNFVRCIGIGPQLKIVDYDPSAPHHLRYQPELDLVAAGIISAEDARIIRDTTLTINTFFGWDFNSCELIKKDGVWHPFDFANPCPDSQVTSLHIHFPWIVLGKIRWALFCAATRRRMRKTLDWDPYYEVAERDVPYADKLTAYAGIAHERLDTEAFEAFCDEHLADLDTVAKEFFGSARAKDAVRMKVQALFPEHEWDEFTEHFWTQIQQWREAS